jgi:hypothetical protein
MNFIQALSTTRDDIGFHDYLQPLIKELHMKGGSNPNPEPKKKPAEPKEKPAEPKEKPAEPAKEEPAKEEPTEPAEEKPAEEEPTEEEIENKNELFKQQLQERKKGRESSYKFFVEVLGWIFYILYLPIKPWIWIVTETSKKLQNLYSGMIVPL